MISARSIRDLVAEFANAAIVAVTPRNPMSSRPGMSPR